MIVVVNKSKLVSTAEAKIMTRACAAQLRQDASPIWNKPPLPVVFSSTEADAPPRAWVIALLNDADQADDLGWHTEDQGEVIYGRVFARPVLESGGTVLAGQNSVASVLSHEVLETFVDPTVNLWADRGDGVAIALEVADPVESDSYLIDVDGTEVNVSNFVTPYWFDPQAKPKRRFDFMRTTKGPFKMSPGGYVVEMREGKVSQRFGAQYPEWRRAMKAIDVARTARRIAEPAVTLV